MAASFCHSSGPSSVGMSCATTDPARERPATSTAVAVKPFSVIGFLLSERPRSAGLRAMHHPALRRIEGVAAVQGAAVVPHDEITRPPAVMPGEARLRRVLPDRVEQALRFRVPQAVDAGVG